MPGKDSQNASPLPPCAPLNYEFVERTLRERLKDSIAPLSLEVDCVALQTWAKNASPKRFRHHQIIKELKLWEHYIQRRPVNRIWVNNPFTIMDAPSLTELVYAMGQNLNLRKGHHVEHAVTLPHHTINRQNIALLRGLEFNHMQVALDESCSINQALELKLLLQEFKFSYISFEITVDTDPSKDTMRIMEVLSFLSPSTLVLRPEPLDLSNLESLTQVLMQFGYTFHPPNNIVEFRSSLYNRPNQILSLGPESISQLNGLTIRNLADANYYHDYLSNERLPIQCV